MLTNPFGIADFIRSRINEADACTVSIADLQVGQQRNLDRGNQSHKTLIADQMRKFSAQMDLHLFSVIGFERAIVRLVKMNQNSHHFTWMQLASPHPLLAALHQAFPPLRFKTEPEIIDSAKQFEYTHFMIPPMNEEKFFV
jgi:hypothetical protein